MLKNSKKQETPVTPTGSGQVTITLPNGSTVTGDVATVMEFYRRQANLTGGPPEPEKTLGLYETITGFVTDLTRAISGSIERMAQATLPDGTKAEKIDPQYLSFAVTQASYILQDIKYELAEVLCAANDPNGTGGEIDMKRLQDYFAGVELAAEEILRGGPRVLPSLRPFRDKPLPCIVKLPVTKNISAEYVGPCATRKFKTDDQRAASAADETDNG